MIVSGKHNGITDVKGILVGNYTADKFASGVTVVLCPEGAITAVEVRGSAPGTRETDALAPTNLVEQAQAIVLSGGSVYGLSAADGVIGWLAGRGCGFPVGQNQVAPIVPAAVLYDLGRGQKFVPPISAEWGWKACQSADSGPVAMGCVGAGTGAMSGGIKGGLGTASVLMPSDITVAALAAVNSLGSAVNPDTGRIWENRLAIGEEFDFHGRRAVVLPPPSAGAPATHTTLAVVATDAALNRVQALKVAQMAHDGLARAIRPSHTMFDGDTIFCMATGKQPLPQPPGFLAVADAQALNDIGHLAADCLTRAIIHAILAAGSTGKMIAFRDLSSR
jgi:L-aminopeptidase/D-esterase-like protein